MNEADLEKLGLPLGHWKRLKAIAALTSTSGGSEGQVDRPVARRCSAVSG